MAWQHIQTPCDITILDSVKAPDASINSVPSDWVVRRLDGFLNEPDEALKQCECNAADAAVGVADLHKDTLPGLPILHDPVQCRRVFAGMARRLSQDKSQQEDLIQEASIHLWQRLQHHPRQRQSWYLQSCFDHLRNFIRRGRSVDSPSHRRTIANREQSEADVADQAPSEEDMFSNVCAQDLVEELAKRLPLLQQRTLGCLAKGLSLRETASQLKTSHTTINKHRLRIQALAMRSYSLAQTKPAPVVRVANPWPDPVLVIAGSARLRNVVFQK